jgi:hypothetical protein
VKINFSSKNALVLNKKKTKKMTTITTLRVVFLLLVIIVSQTGLLTESLALEANYGEDDDLNENSNPDHNQSPQSFPTPLSKKLPQAIIIGAKKCGTRALLKFIGAHPNVTTAGAEVHFFDRFYHKGFDWYR